MREPIANIDEIRRAFDASFALPEKGAVEPYERMLAIRVGDMRFALRVSEIGGVEAMGKIVPLPKSLPGLLGIAGVRRRIVAVYALGELLFGRRTDTPKRWLLLGANHDTSIAFAFDAVDGCLDIAPSRIHPIEQTTANEYLSGMVADDGILRPLLHLPTLTAFALSIARTELRGTKKG